MGDFPLTVVYGEGFFGPVFGTGSTREKIMSQYSQKIPPSDQMNINDQMITTWGNFVPGKLFIVTAKET